MKLKELVESNSYQLYIDMDGVLVDFLKGIETLLGHKHDENRYTKDKEYRKKFWRVIHQYNKKEGKHFWSELDEMDDAMELWNYVKKYDPEILTATGNMAADDAADQKRKWIKEHIGSGVKVNVTESGKDKGPEFAGENKILIDDQPKSIKPWREAGGIGILHKSAKKTIKKLKDLGL